jgi:hypothetical protein
MQAANNERLRSAIEAAMRRCGENSMKIVINHLTRMQKGFICVAGVDLAAEQHVRPMLRSQMRKDLLARYGGPFDVGRVLELGWTKYVGTRPESEDYLFRQSEVRCLGEMPADEYWALLRRLARSRLDEIFGADLLPRGPRSHAVEVGRGVASLGCYLAIGRPQLGLQQRDALSGGRIRIQFRSGERDFDLGVTDIRLYGADHVTPDAAIVQRVAERLQGAPEVILGVGLTRAFRGADDEPAMHWLQVNNLHFPNDPVWRLG